MSVRGPRGGRGRGRGRGRTMIWEWETYTPSPAVYDNIWHVRQAPVAVTPTVPSDCPMPDARTRILERRQTEDGFGRNFYLVEVTQGGTEVQRVDVSRILQYVSPRELERFENEQFRVEAEAQAAADREEVEEQIRRRMAKNARMAGSGRGRGSRMLDGLGIDSELKTASIQARPRGRGRGRARGRGNWRGRGGLVADSALPLSPVQPHRPEPPPALRRGHPEVPDIGDTDTTSEDSQSTASEDEDGHRSKRRRTESMTPQHTLKSPPSSQGEESESEDDSIPPEPPSTVKAHKSQHDNLDDYITPRAGHSMLQKPAVEIDETQDDSEDDEDAEEYVVEAIIEHYYDEEGRKFYLVKWEGYEDSHDWLPEEDLEGAAELVNEYNERVRRRKGKERGK